MSPEKRFNPPSKASKVDVLLLTILCIFPLIFFPLGFFYGIKGLFGI